MNLAARNSIHPPLFSDGLEGHVADCLWTPFTVPHVLMQGTAGQV